MEIVLVGNHEFTLLHHPLSGWTGIRWADNEQIGPAPTREVLLEEARRLPGSRYKWWPVVVDEINACQVEDWGEDFHSYDSPREAYEKALEVARDLEEVRWPQTFLAKAEREDGKDSYGGRDYDLAGKNARESAGKKGR